MKRSHEPELIDLGLYEPEEYSNCLYQLDRIGRYLGGDKATFWALRQIDYLSSILDIGCGGGLFTLRLGHQFPNAKIVGADISEGAISFAKERRKEDVVENVEFVLSLQKEINYSPESFDVVTATLMCHHLNDGELINFLKDSYKIAKKAVILNDLHRHELAYIGFACMSPLFFKNRLIMSDGLLSIKRAFTRSEWQHFLKAAEIPPDECFITWHWAFRWIITIKKKQYDT